MKIVVLAGGISTERDVSLSSGSMIYKALKENDHQVIMLDVFLGYEGDDYKEIFEKDMENSRQASSQWFRAKSLIRRTLWPFFKLFSPLM